MLFSRIKPEFLKDFKPLLNNFTNDRNRKRRFKKLGWRTPDEWLANYQVVSVAALLIYHSQQNGIGHLARKTGEVIDILSSNSVHQNKIKDNEKLSKVIGQNDEKKVKLAA